jgi:hypothetical protein
MKFLLLMVLVAFFYTGSCLEEQSIGCRPCIYACRVGSVCKCGQCVLADQPADQPTSAEDRERQRKCEESKRNMARRGFKVNVICHGSRNRSPARPHRHGRHIYTARTHKDERCIACPRSCTFRGFRCNCKGNCDSRSRRISRHK